MAATPLWLAPIEAELNRGIYESSRATALAARLEGRSFAVDIHGIVRLRSVVRGGRLILSTAADVAADALISGPPSALIGLALASQDRPLDNKAASLVGDAEIARSFKELFAAARPDFAEILSRFIGDIAAHRVARAATAVFVWGQHTLRTTAANINEYLVEESRVLVNDTELGEFLQGVDRLRETGDRVEARLQYLERKHSTT
jgi:ubiquinone biosynthesis accessory factor UbiJ